MILWGERVREKRSGENLVIIRKKERKKEREKERETEREKERDRN